MSLLNRPKPHEPMWRNSPLRIYLRKVRGEQGVTAEQLSEDLGFHRGFIGARERGYVAPTIIELMEWVNALGFRLCIVPKDIGGNSVAPDNRYRAHREEIAAQTLPLFPEIDASVHKPVRCCETQYTGVEIATS